MHKKITIAIFCIAIALSIWFYGHSDLKLKQQLTKTEWRSNTMIFTDRWNQNDKLTYEANVVSIYKYLPNGTYLKQSTIEFTHAGKVQTKELNIAESGKWEISDHYLLITPDEFKDTSTDSFINDLSNQAQVDKIKQFFRINSQFSRKIDHINDNTLFMSDLDHGSVLLNKVNNS